MKYGFVLPYGDARTAADFARDAEEVIAVEEDPVAISDGRRNVQRNALGNCRFVRSSAEGLAVKDEIHVLVVDPPRPGLTSKTFERILGLAPETIVYVSCNPSTLARDLKNFAERYTLESVRMIDFFPQTYHIESMAILRLR